VPGGDELVAEMSARLSKPAARQDAGLFGSKVITSCRGLGQRLKQGLQPFILGKQQRGAVNLRCELLIGRRHADQCHSLAQSVRLREPLGANMRLIGSGSLSTAVLAIMSANV
jgi:hypothetical protein